MLSPFLHCIWPFCAFAFPNEIYDQLVNFFNVSLAFQWGWHELLCSVWGVLLPCNTQRFLILWNKTSFPLLRILIFSNHFYFGAYNLCTFLLFVSKPRISDTTVNEIPFLISFLYCSLSKYRATFDVQLNIKLHLWNLHSMTLPRPFMTSSNFSGLIEIFYMEDHVVSK